MRTRASPSRQIQSETRPHPLDCCRRCCRDMILTATPAAQAQENAARKILKAMSDYVAAQKVISLTFDSDIEVMTVELQKIQFTSSGQRC